MDAKTLKALKASIAKWRKNLKAETPEAVRYGGDECALCDLFNDSSFCTGCPVFERTARRFCSGTPYHRAVTGLHIWRTDGNRQAFIDGAKAEVAFLESLLPVQP